MAGGIRPGTIDEMHAFFYQGPRRFTVTVTSGSSWTAVETPGRRDSGTATARDGRVVLDGPLAGEGSPLHYSLKDRGYRELRAIVETSFGGRSATGTLRLTRVPVTE